MTRLAKIALEHFTTIWLVKFVREDGKLVNYTYNLKTKEIIDGPGKYKAFPPREEVEIKQRKIYKT